MQMLWAEVHEVDAMVMPLSGDIGVTDFAVQLVIKSVEALIFKKVK